MIITDAIGLARKLLDERGLVVWGIKIDNAVNRFGQCNYRRKTINLSRKLVELNDEEHVRDTILHEIAHALTPGQGHNRLWKKVAAEIGARPERCYDSKAVVMPPAKFKGTCPNCGYEINRHRRRPGLACGKCCKGVYNEDYRFKWTNNAQATPQE